MRAHSWLTLAALCASSRGICQPSTNPGFERLKALAGRWQGVRYDGKPVYASYELVSNGTAVIARFQTEGDAEMVTLYTASGDRLVATHYCAAGNQPQLQTTAVSPGQQQFQFSFLRATNLRDANDGHMIALMLTIDNNDSFSEEWVWAEGGKRERGLFRYTRAK